MHQPELLDTQTLLPHRICEIHYGVLSPDDIHRLSVLPCRRIMGMKDLGVNDRRLGVCDRASLCATCGLKSADCVGHAGHVDIALPVFHLGFFPTVLRICRTICKSCAAPLLSPEERVYYKRKLLSSKLDALQRAILAKSVQEDAYKTRTCFRCGAANGVVRKGRPLRIVHEPFRSVGGAQRKDDADEELLHRLSTACHLNNEVDVFKENALDFLDPVRVRELFRKIDAADVCLLGLSPGVRPEDLLVSSLLVPPLCVRPSGPSATGNGTREDELTLQYNDILANSDAMLDGSLDTVRLVETWDMLQVRAAKLLDSALPGFPPHMRNGDGKSYAQRLKGKHGRFRGNLSGKRVDFSGRSVISPDPNLAIDELAVPLRVARVLTYPQRVFAHNLEAMRRLVRNGPTCHPGAVTVTFTREGIRKGLQFDRDAIAAKLSPGDIVERHIQSGDLMLFNRQPSLHRLSMMCHRARVLPHRTLRFNECCCAPYNADFDGDEMNIHLVQTEEARAEALTLMLTSRNIVTAKNGEPIIACTQDFLTAAYLVTSRDVFLDRSQFTQCVSHWLRQERFDLPLPAIFKPVELWTGKQLFDTIIAPRASQRGDAAKLDLEAATKSYTGHGKHACPAEGYAAFLGSTMISGRLDKKLLGGGAKEGLFARLVASLGGEYAALCMNRIAQFTSRWLMNFGFSLGLGDVFPTPSLVATKRRVLDESFDVCAQLIHEAQKGNLQPLPGLTVRQTLEAQLNRELSKVRDTCGQEAVSALAPTNAPLIMALSGSKGSTLNIAQMMACVGQQTVNGKRIQNSFVDRSLPHFPRFAEHPAARGFVANSFFSSLEPTEFFFHTMAGREGLVDTAVKTAETGYIYRRLMKAMEDLSVKYDYTVRNSKGDIVQLCYGEDRLDPMLMEGPNGTPLNLPMEWTSLVRELSTTEPQYSLSPADALTLMTSTLSCGKEPFRSCSEKFREDLSKFLRSKLEEQRLIRKGLHLPLDPVRGREAPQNACAEHWQTKVVPMTERILVAFLYRCASKYLRKRCEPGTPCGAIAAQSVGEPSTQMTLRTFHFAGVASMSITQGVPRLVEIINANKSIATPVIYAPLVPNTSRIAAVALKARIERVLLREVLTEIVEVVHQGQVFLRLFLNRRLINDLQLVLDAQKVRRRILETASKPMSPMKLLKERNIIVHSRDVLDVVPFEVDGARLLFHVQQLLVFLPCVVVDGIPGIKRAVISCKKDSAQKEIVAEGAELREVMNLAGVDGKRATCNHITVVEKVLGVEAARATIVSEIQSIMRAYSLSIDIRHVYLLADVMTHRGAVLGITRYGIQKMNSGVLTMASFERTTEHLYNAALYQRVDKQLSVSENIIVGSPVPLGTHAFTVLQAKAALTVTQRIRPIAVEGAFHLDL